MSDKSLNDVNNMMDIIISAMTNGWTTDLKIAYIRYILPKHYEVKEDERRGSICCKSRIGINDHECWGILMAMLRNKFTDFLEVFHNTCYNHKDFIIYFEMPKIKA